MRRSAIAHFNSKRSALEKYVTFSGVIVKNNNNKKKSILCKVFTLRLTADGSITTNINK